MLKEIIIAIQSYYNAHRFIVKHKLWQWILIPGVIYAILFCAGIFLLEKAAMLRSIIYSRFPALATG